MAICQSARRAKIHAASSSALRCARSWSPSVITVTEEPTWGASASGKQVEIDAYRMPGRASISCRRSIACLIGGCAVIWFLPQIIGSGASAMAGRTPSRSTRAIRSAHSRPRSA